MRPDRRIRAFAADDLVAIAGAPAAQFCLSRLAGSLPGDVS